MSDDDLSRRLLDEPDVRCAGAGLCPARGRQRPASAVALFADDAYVQGSRSRGPSRTTCPASRSCASAAPPGSTSSGTR